MEKAFRPLLHLAVTILGIFLVLSWQGHDLSKIRGGETAYESEAYGFALEYPSTWGRYEWGPEGFYGFHLQRLYLFADVLNLGPPGQVTVDQVPIENPAPESLAEQALDRIHDYFSSYEGEESEVKSFGGLTLLTRTYQVPGVFCREVYIPRSADGIILRISGDLADMAELEAVFERIVLSFRDTASLTR
jgi:hypothetical protein